MLVLVRPIAAASPKCWQLDSDQGTPAPGAAMVRRADQRSHRRRPGAGRADQAPSADAAADRFQFAADARRRPDARLRVALSAVRPHAALHLAGAVAWRGLPNGPL